LDLPHDCSDLLDGAMATDFGLEPSSQRALNASEAFHRR
jgi:hypothetical protein